MSKNNNDYDFSEFFEEDENVDEDGNIKDPTKKTVPGLDPGEEDPRDNLKIVRCCANCKNFWYWATKSPRRGFCLLPDPDSKRPDTKSGESYDKEYIRNNYLRVHVTNYCDHHEFRHERNSIRNVADWTGVPFNFDGSQIEE